jgi:hypothetical protein
VKNGQADSGPAGAVQGGGGNGAAQGYVEITHPVHGGFYHRKTQTAYKADDGGKGGSFRFLVKTAGQLQEDGKNRQATQFFGKGYLDEDLDQQDANPGFFGFGEQALQNSRQTQGKGPPQKGQQKPGKTDGEAPEADPNKDRHNRQSGDCNQKQEYPQAIHL